MATVFAREGYTVITADARAHGESEGSIATYGLEEADDVRRWVELSRTRSSGCVYGFGQSLGAAMLLQSLRAETGLCAIVAEASFPSFPAVATDRIQQRLEIAPWLLAPPAALVVRLGELYARWRYGIDLRRASPEAAVEHARVPVLLVHGTADHLAPVKYGERLRSRNPAHVTLWTVPGATHTQAWAAVGDEFPRRVIEFYRTHGR
jgi:hypothetical protein